MQLFQQKTCISGSCKRGPCPKDWERLGYQVNTGWVKLLKDAYGFTVDIGLRTCTFGLGVK